jgi:hypothetical protein
MLGIVLVMFGLVVSRLVFRGQVQVPPYAIHL